MHIHTLTLRVVKIDPQIINTVRNITQEEWIN